MGETHGETNPRREEANGEKEKLPTKPKEEEGEEGEEGEEEEEVMVGEKEKLPTKLKEGEGEEEEEEVMVGQKEKLPAKLKEEEGEEEEQVMVAKSKKDDELKSKKPPHFVLVHGISHGAWCWYKIKCLMENSGYRVSCIDLKGSGIDRTDPNTIFSFQDYNQPLLDLLSALPDDEQVILVGHSAGGLNVTDATYKFPQKIKLVVYIAATMLKRGMVNQEDFKNGIPDFSDIGDFGDVYDIGFGSGTNEPPTSVILKRELLRKLNYQMCPPEDYALAAMLVRPGPIRVLTSVIFKEGEGVSEDAVDKVPRIYIKTMQDRVLKPKQQEALIKRWPPLDVYVLESDHSPFFSTPSMLSSLLVKAVASL